MILIIIKINIYCDACVSTSNIFLVRVFRRAGLIENAQIPGRSTPWKARKLNFIGEWTTRLPTRHQNITTKTYCGFVEDQRRWVTCLEGSSAPPTIHKLVAIVWTFKLFTMISWCQMVLRRCTWPSEGSSLSMAMATVPRMGHHHNYHHDDQHQPCHPHPTLVLGTAVLCLHLPCHSL